LWFFFFFKQKTAYEFRISDWSSDVCSSDLIDACRARGEQFAQIGRANVTRPRRAEPDVGDRFPGQPGLPRRDIARGRIVGAAHRAVEVEALEHRNREFEKIGRASCRERGCQYV